MNERLLQLLMTAEIRRETISLEAGSRWNFLHWLQRKFLPRWRPRPEVPRSLEVPYRRRKATRWI
jgi:hypothetical protein